MAVWLFYETNMLLSKAQKKPKLQLTWRALGPDPILSPTISPSATLQHGRWRRNTGGEQSFISQTARKIYVSVWVTPGWYLDKIYKALLDSHRACDMYLQRLNSSAWAEALVFVLEAGACIVWDSFILPNSTLSILSSELTSPLDLVLAAWSRRHASLRSVTPLYFPRLAFSWAFRCCYLSNPHIFPRQRTSQINIRHACTRLLILFVQHRLSNGHVT